MFPVPAIRSDKQSILSNRYGLIFGRINRRQGADYLYSPRLQLSTQPLQKQAARIQA